MKQPTLTKWPKDIEPLKGMLLFVQLWDEMLFDFALDSYQPRRFNVLGLCSELIDAYEYFENNLLSARSISPIIEELLNVLSEDSICKQSLGAELPIVQGVFRSWNPDKPDKRVTYAADSMLRTVEPIMQARLVEKLQAIVPDAKKKEDTIDLSRRLLTEILRNGYSSNFIYYSLQNRFFGNAVAGFQELHSFLKLFEGGDKKYEVVFKMGPEGRLIARNAEKDFLQLVDKIDAKFPGSRFESAFLTTVPGELFVVASDIDARDEFSARREAVERLTNTATLVGFLKHGIQMNSEKEALIYEGMPPARVYVTKAPLRPTFKRDDVPDEAFDGALVELVQAYVASAETDRRTANRIEGALRAHIVGVHADISENQFSNLWTALETIAGTSPDRNTINIMLRRLVPILCLKYFLKLVRQLRNDVRYCIRPAFDKCLLQKMVGENEMDFLVRILSQDDCEPLRKILYAGCDNNPLLQYRIFRFHELLRSPQKALSLLNEHEQRIRWHIQRLYRARNVVIHAGVGYELIDLLTENVHEYFDHVLSEITDRMRSSSQNPSIEKIFAQYEWEYQAYKEELKHLASQKSDMKTAKTIVFGLHSR